MDLLLTLRSEIVCLAVLLLMLWYSSSFGPYENSKQFRLLNLFAIGHVVFDIITVITVNNQDVVPPLANRVCHEIFYAFAIFFCYILLRMVLDMSFDGKAAVIAGRVLGLVPAGYLIAMSFLPIDYINGNGTWYSYGTCVFAGYACALFLFTLSFLLIIIRAKRFSAHDRWMLIPTFIAMMGAMGLQVYLPEFLFTGGIATLATLSVYMGIVDPVGRFRHKAYIDHMTGLRNHNCYDDDMAALQRGMGDEAAERDFIYVSCDINGLKQINDEQGHAEGDEYICHAATVIKRSLTGARAVYRTGGDEFCAVYIHKSEAQVQREIEILRENFGKGLPDAVLKTVTDRPFSLSIGYAPAIAGESVMETARRADANMMEEKRKYYEVNGLERRRTAR